MVWNIGKICSVVFWIDIYEEVINEIIVFLEVGICFWFLCWVLGVVLFLFCYEGIVYCGINILLFWVVVMLCGYFNLYWMMYC